MESWRSKLKSVTGERQARSRKKKGRPEVRQLVDRLVTALTEPKQRQAAVQVVQQQCMPEVRSLVIDRLVGVVKRGGRANGDALASLVQLGTPTLRALTRELERSGRTEEQLRLIKALSVFAGHPSFTGHVDLTMDLACMLPRVVDVDVRNAIANLLAALRVRSGLRTVFAGLDTPKE
jgi:hypothetical protein